MDESDSLRSAAGGQASSFIPDDLRGLIPNPDAVNLTGSFDIDHTKRVAAFVCHKNNPSALSIRERHRPLSSEDWRQRSSTFRV